MSNKCQGFETTGHHITLVWLIVTTIDHVLLSITFQPKTLTTIGAAKLHRANIFAEMFTHGSINLVLTVDTDIVFPSHATIALLVCFHIRSALELLGAWRITVVISPGNWVYQLLVARER